MVVVAVDGKSNDLSPEAHRRALRLRLKRIQRKIVRVEEEIAEAQRPDFRMVLTIEARCFPH